MRRYITIFRAIFLPLLLAFALFIPALAGAATSTTVTVDFGQNWGAVNYRASGFLHSMSNTVPADELIAPVAPRLFRGDIGEVPNFYNRLTRLGVAYKQSVLSDYYYEGAIPGDNNNWTDWETRCTNEVTKDKNAGRQVQYDIWNEPNGNYFWPRSLDQFKETWRRGFLKIREANPNADIVGPSTTHWNKVWINDFLTYCKANNVVPNILSWHELGENPASIAAHMAEARQMITDLGIGDTVTRFSINELTPGGARHTAPGMAIAFIGGLERASAQGTPSVESAALSVWEGGYILDGMLDAGGNRRSLWYAFKFYGDMKGVLVSCTGAAPFDGVASYDAGASSAVIALGEYQGKANDLLVKCMNVPAGLTKGGAVQATVYRITDNGLAPSAGPAFISRSNYPVTGNDLYLPMPNPGAYGGYEILLSPAVEASAESKVWGGLY